MDPARPTELAAKVSRVDGLDGFLQALESNAGHLLAQGVVQNSPVLRVQNLVNYVVDDVLSILIITTLSKEVLCLAQDVGTTKVLVPLTKGIKTLKTLMVLLVI